MTKRATMNDIALAAGVSQATVSLVLNEVTNARVSSTTRRKVKDLASDMGYPSKPALTRTGVSIIGLLIDDVTSTPFAPPFLEGARAAAAERGTLIATFCTGADPATEAAALQILHATGAKGVLYTTLVTRSVKPPARLATLPAILLNCHDTARRFPCVIPADADGAMTATAALIAAGHRRIAHLAGENWGEAARDRAQGYRRALAAHGIPYDPALQTGPAWTVASGRDHTHHLLNLPDPPTAIFCFNDRVAIGCYEALHDRGLNVPHDVSVIGFDNDDLGANLQPPLTTMVLPHDEMARFAVATLLNAQGPLPHSRSHIPCDLFQRASIAPPKPL